MRNRDKNTHTRIGVLPTGLLLTTFCTLSVLMLQPLPAQALESDSQQTPSHETRIVFTYMSKHCCSCQIAPDICGGGFYMRSVQKRIFDCWTPPVARSIHPVKVRFRIHKNGRLSDLKLVKSVSEQENNAALNAVKAAAPFFKLPEQSPKFVDLEFTFSKSSKGYHQREQQHTELFAIAPYLLILQEKIEESWRKPSSGVVVVAFGMHADGSLTDAAVVQSSGVAEADNLALKALDKSSPLDLPPGLPADIQVRVTFDPQIPMAWISEAVVKR